VAFHITISYNIYSHTRWQQSSDVDGGHTSIHWGRQWCTVCACVHSNLQTF